MCYELRWAKPEEWPAIMNMVWNTFIRFDGQDCTKEGRQSFYDFITDPNLFQAFVDGMHDPEKRPTAAQWEKALVKTWDLLQPCRNPNCRGKWFILHDLRRPVCPHCGQRIDAGDVMHLRLKKPMRGRRGQWQQVGEINLYDKMPLFQWHFVADLYPDEKMQDRSMQAYISHQGEAWYLVNNALTGMLSPKGNLVPVGQAVWLRDGAMFPSCNKQDALLMEAVKG